jgi:hypothetical protein
MCLVSAAVFGFFLLGLGPLGFQYGAELTYPAPEAASNGLLLMVGQISGIGFILGMDALKDPATGSVAGSMTAHEAHGAQAADDHSRPEADHQHLTSSRTPACLRLVMTFIWLYPPLRRAAAASCLARRAKPSAAASCSGRGVTSLPVARASQ